MNQRIYIFVPMLLFFPTCSNAMLKAKVIKAVGATAVAGSAYATIKIQSSPPHQFVRQIGQKIRDRRLAEQYRLEYAQQTETRLSER